MTYPYLQDPPSPITYPYLQDPPSPITYAYLQDPPSPVTYIGGTVMLLATVVVTVASASREARETEKGPPQLTARKDVVEREGEEQGAFPSRVGKGKRESGGVEGEEGEDPDWQTEQRGEKWRGFGKGITKELSGALKGTHDGEEEKEGGWTKQSLLWGLSRFESVLGEITKGRLGRTEGVGGEGREEVRSWEVQWIEEGK